MEAIAARLAARPPPRARGTEAPHARRRAQPRRPPLHVHASKTGVRTSLFLLLGHDRAATVAALSWLRGPLAAGGDERPRGVRGGTGVPPPRAQPETSPLCSQVPCAAY